MDNNEEVVVVEENTPETAPEVVETTEETTAQFSTRPVAAKVVYWSYGFCTRYR